MRDPDAILAEAARTLDLSQPVGLVMLGIMGQLPDADQPHALLRRYLDALPSGSYLALCDGADSSPALNEAIAVYNQNSASSYHLRSREQIGAFFDGLTMVPPGLVPASRWGGGDSADEPADDDPRRRRGPQAVTAARWRGHQAETSPSVPPAAAPHVARR